MSQALCRKGLNSSRARKSFSFCEALRLAGFFLMLWSWMAFCIFSMVRSKLPPGCGSFSSALASAGCMSRRRV